MYADVRDANAGALRRPRLMTWRVVTLDCRIAMSHVPCVSVLNRSCVLVRCPAVVEGGVWRPPELTAVVTLRFQLDQSTTVQYGDSIGLLKPELTVVTRFPIELRHIPLSWRNNHQV